MAKILIIGAGVSGLSAGIYARLNGHDATICEKHFNAGGNLTGWQRGEYHVDNCIHWLTGTNPATQDYKTWCDLGALGSVNVYQGETLYTFEQDGLRLSLNKDLEVIKEDMLNASPLDEKEIKAFISAVKTVQGIMGIAGKNHDKKSGVAAKLTALPTLIKYNGITTGELALKFYSPLIQNFITSLMGEEFSAMALIVVFATFCGENGGIPEGSSVGMAKRMENRFKELGGKLYLKKEAVNIKYENGVATQVEFSDNTTLPADYIVIATDPEIAYHKLLKQPMPKQLTQYYAQNTRFSSYQCAFACDKSELPFSADFIFEIPKKYKAKLRTKNLIIREFSHEKSFAPKGKNIIQTLTFCSEKDARDFIKLRKDKEKYEEKKGKIAQLIVEIIEDKFPTLKGKLTLLDVWTPATYNRYTGAETGSFMGFILPAKTIPHTLDNKVKNLNNVILATQWLQSPGGLPIAAKVGKAAIETINKKEKALQKA